MNVERQLSLSDLWSEEGPVPELRFDAPKRDVASDLLDGPHVLRGELELACEALDAAAMERTFATLQARFELPAWADEVPGVLELVRALDARSSREVLEWARATADQRPLARRVRLSALRRAMRRVLESEGAAAVLSDGAPVAALALGLGDAALATKLISDACDADPLRVAWWVTLAKHADRDEVAVRAWCRALMLEPELSDDAVLQCRLAANLIDEGDALELDQPTRWLCVLADLKRVVPLDELIFSAPETHEVHAVARALRRFRVDRAALSEAERVERKRALLRACPQLKKLWRTL